MQVRDPVCGMEIDSSKVVATVVAGGQTYYFCSKPCHDKFRAHPDQYTKKEAAKSQPSRRGG